MHSFFRLSLSPTSLLASVDFAARSLKWRLRCPRGWQNDEAFFISAAESDRARCGALMRWKKCVSVGSKTSKNINLIVVEKTRTLTAIFAAVDAASNAFSCLFISHKLRDHTSSAYSTFVTASLRRIITIESILMNCFFSKTSRFWLLSKLYDDHKLRTRSRNNSPSRGSWTFSGRWNCIS